MTTERWRFLVMGVLTVLVPAGACAAQEPGVRLGEPQTATWQMGLEVRATGAIQGITATLPMPMEWPEQDVRIVSEEKTRHVRSLRYRTLDDGARQLLVTIPRMAAGEVAQVLVTVEVTRRAIEEPQDPSEYRAPERIGRDLASFMGVSPFIETRHPRIQAIADELASREAASDWERVEATFDWVRQNIEYQFDEEIKGALTALEDGRGDCEELTSLFVALCRAQGIPARAVWIPDHCYPEFYLEDTQGEGHWFPCQAAGEREFGAMTEFRPILQKGDRIRVPGMREPVRYIAERLEARNAAAPPEVRFLRRRVENEDRRP